MFFCLSEKKCYTTRNKPKPSPFFFFWILRRRKKNFCVVVVTHSIKKHHFRRGTRITFFFLIFTRGKEKDSLCAASIRAHTQRGEKKTKRKIVVFFCVRFFFLFVHSLSCPREKQKRKHFGFQFFFFFFFFGSKCPFTLETNVDVDFSLNHQRFYVFRETWWRTY